jgi:2-keto-4-pentenoate hydratase/2-oxohepta-3-ene-1,7-dioic acid hydratase in catechol pathway
VRLVTFVDSSGTERIGALFDNDRRIADLASAEAQSGRPGTNAFANMLALIDGGEPALDRARNLLAQVAAGSLDTAVASDAVRLLAPIPVPRQMRDFLCFEQHLIKSREMRFRKTAAREPDPEAAFKAFKDKGLIPPPKVWYEQPIYYRCNTFNVIGTGADIVWPSYCRLLDYELEYAACIGKRGRNIKAGEARGYIFGYTIFNDISARDTQAKEMEGQLGPGKGKDFDTGNVMGPCLVTADEIPDPYALAMRAKINGEQWTDGHSSTMHWRFEDLIVRVSQDETLHPGEYLCSGTVGGGCGIEQDRWLKPGDLVELEVERIGVLSNRVVKPN